jgi:hypothetical protein
MKYEKYVQYTSRWYRIDLKKYDKELRHNMVKWCAEHSLPGKFHYICTYFEKWDSNLNKWRLNENLIELRISNIANYTEFILRYFDD